MDLHLDTVQLKDGEQMRVVRVLAPDAQWRDRIVPLLGHKGEPWVWQMEVALDEGLEGLEQYFYLGVLRSGEAVGNVMTVESMTPPIGILGHVYTPPEHRRKGICSALMEAAVDDFAARDGRALFLHTGYDSPPYHIYASFGFEGWRDTGTMRLLNEADFFDRQFEPRPVDVRETQWGDWPPLEALSEVVGGWHVRSAVLGCYGFGGFEGHYIRMRRDLEEGRIREFKVLASQDGAVMGYALLGRLSGFPGQPLCLDVFVHPAWLDHAARLAQAVALPEAGKVLAFAASGDDGKPETLAAVGFEQEAAVRDVLTDDDGNERDLLIFSRD